MSKAMWLGAAWLILTGAGPVKPVRAAENNAPDKIEKRLRQHCDPVCELRTQDTAFALLVETYRQFHGHQIERDFGQRLRAADNMGDAKDGLVIADDSEFMKRLQEFVRTLAVKERELRLAKLQGQVDNLRNAYQCARRGDERATGGPVPSQIDTRAAAVSLREFVIVTPGSMANANLDSPPVLPAAALLLDAPPEPLPSWETVAACTPDDPILIIEPPEDTAPPVR